MNFFKKKLKKEKPEATAPAFHKVKEQAGQKKSGVPEDEEINNIYLDIIKGSMIGGAVGDALGYPVEFMRYSDIIKKYGDNGITKYKLKNGKALISDDTQMSLFTAAGFLFCIGRYATKGIMGDPSGFVKYAYLDWLKTQHTVFSSKREKPNIPTWLYDVPELYSCRAPGNT